VSQKAGGHNGKKHVVEIIDVGVTSATCNPALSKTKHKPKWLPTAPVAAKPNQNSGGWVGHNPNNKYPAKPKPPGAGVTGKPSYGKPPTSVPSSYNKPAPKPATPPNNAPKPSGFKPHAGGYGKPKPNGFTLIELLVVIVIIAVIAVIAAMVVPAWRLDPSAPANPYAFPDTARAQAMQQQADALIQANDLKRQELELRKQGK
jgi:prepilin-type N-terminal cleavage/methylation domain-containing protein